MICLLLTTVTDEGEAVVKLDFDSKEELSATLVSICRLFHDASKPKPRDTAHEEQ